MTSQNEPSNFSDPASDSEPDVPLKTSAASFQLYLVPLIVVLICVLGWLFVYWLLHEEQDPESLVRSMQQADRRGWSAAYALSELMRNPENGELRGSHELCGELAAILSRQLDDTDSRGEAQLKFCRFLCRALGEFEVIDGLPTLLNAAELPNEEETIGVRCAAIEALAVLADNVGPARLRAEPRAVSVLLASSRPTGPPLTPAAQLRLASTAAFAMGVVGGPEINTRLIEMLKDPRSDVRFNAATGLARRSDTAAEPVVVEMLTTADTTVGQNEKTASAHEAKRLIVLTNGIQAAVRLMESDPTTQHVGLIDALRELAHSKDVPSRVQLDAKTALLKITPQ